MHGVVDAGRLAWFGSTGWSDDGFSDYVLNRLAFVIFFTAFTLIIFFWWDLVGCVLSMAFTNLAGGLPSLHTVQGRYAPRYAKPHSHAVDDQPR